MWAWKCTPVAQRIVQNFGRPHRAVAHGIGRFVRTGRTHFPTHAMLVTATTCAFVPLAAAVAVSALPAFVPVKVTPISFAPEGPPEGASDVGSWKRAAIPTQAAQPATLLSMPASRGDAPAFNVPSSIDIELLVAINRLGSNPLPLGTTLIPAMAIPETVIPVSGVQPVVATEIDEPGSLVLFALSILWIVASRLHRPLHEKNIGWRSIPMRSVR